MPKVPVWGNWLQRSSPRTSPWDIPTLRSWVMERISGGSAGKNLPANAGDVGLIPGWRRSPEEGNGNSHQYSCLGSPMDRGS